LSRPMITSSAPPTRGASISTDKQFLNRLPALPFILSFSPFLGRHYMIPGRCILMRGSHDRGRRVAGSLVERDRGERPVPFGDQIQEPGRPGRLPRVRRGRPPAARAFMNTLVPTEARLSAGAPSRPGTACGALLLLSHLVCAVRRWSGKRPQSRSISFSGMLPRKRRCVRIRAGG
jgi:hypothetical protein